jgi:hypothetical protein
MDQGCRLSNESEFDKLLAETAEHLRRSIDRRDPTPQSESTEASEELSGAPSRAVQFSTGVIPGPLVREGARRVHHLFATLFAPRRLSMFRPQRVDSNGRRRGNHGKLHPEFNDHATHSDSGRRSIGDLQR